MPILFRHIVKLSLPMLLFGVAIPLGAIPIGGKADSLSVNDNRRFDYFFMEACSQQAQGNYAAAFDLFEHAKKSTRKRQRCITTWLPTICRWAKTAWH